MAFNRREFVKTASAVSVPLLLSSQAKATDSFSSYLASAKTPKASPLSDEYSILNKISYGATPESAQELKEKGLEAYLKEQLQPDQNDNPIIEKKLSEMSFKVRSRKKEGGGVKEIPITFLNKSNEEIWEYFKANREAFKGPLGKHAGKEVAIQTWLKAVYSKYQLQEVMVEFWHNHFNVDAFSDRRISPMFVLYDRDVMRKHCFGNFRAFLEDVAKSPAMLYYLNNNSSKASPANENYARELFELHTLGEDNYFNELYDKWRDVPGAEQGKAIGYIDEDIYEAARAFTGWTVGDESRTGRRQEKTPSTGKFHYQDSWHDHYQKRVMGVEIPSNQGPMKDALQVLDIVAYHKGTAEFVCKKICKRLVSDTPSKSLVSKAVATWIKHQKDSDQIAQVIKTIVLSDEFKQAKGAKVKRPLELMASYMRVTNMDLTPNEPLHWLLGDLGYQHFQWPAPTGHPDDSEYWVGTGMMLKRWKALELISNVYYPKATTFDELEKTITEQGKTAENYVNYWYKRMIGTEPSTETAQGLLAVLQRKDYPTSSLTLKDKYLARLVVISIGMLSEFQVR